MSQSKFTATNAAAFEADGRTHEHCGKPSQVVTIENSGSLSVLRCTNDAGFRIAIQFDAATGSRQTLSSSDIECVLADGTAMRCSGWINHRDGTLRVDAEGSGNGWFWFLVRPNFRHSFK